MTIDFDFAAFLVAATAVTGLIWAIDALLWAPKRCVTTAEGKRVAGHEPILVEYARSFFPVILIVLLLRSFLVEPFKIPSGSMTPTLLIGDFILVNKFAYGIRLPVLNKKVFDVALPKRGDVFVFRYPKDPTIDYIKRVVGLPGDRIGYFNKTLYINGEVAAQTPLGLYTGSSSGFASANLMQEALPQSQHPILVNPARPSLEGEFIVPEGHYFAMGDNRDNSNDSRYWGFVPEQNLVGKAFFIWMNWDNGINWQRIGTPIR